MVLNRDNIEASEKFPINIIQFGGGNFLRGFIEDAFQILSKKTDIPYGIAIVQPHGNKRTAKFFAEQDNLYTLFKNGIVNGEKVSEKKLITNVSEFISPFENFEGFLSLARLDTLQFVISNTTEAGIAFDESDDFNLKPPKSFPGKLTVFLYERFRFFKGNPKKGLTIIPCELIEDNAINLRNILIELIDLWQLGDGFRKWFLISNSFHNSLVDRIVPGFPKDNLQEYTNQLDYTDNLMVTAEPYFLWAIEDGEDLKQKMPFDKTDLDVKFVPDLKPYRTRKVRILNGAHTAMVPLGLLYGTETVAETLNSGFTGNFIKQLIFDEILPTLNGDRRELKQYANDILDRFKNPFIKHQLSSIALNSISKFKVRVLPSITKYYEDYGKIPNRLVYAFACLIRFYKGSWKQKNMPIQDTQDVLDMFVEAWSTDQPSEVIKTLANHSCFSNTIIADNATIQKALETALMCLEKYGVEKGFEEFKTLNA